ncbi:ABC transporter permease/substrate-binding protein [Altererythrobacter aquiaggeris]|uniref:ABC transporter permease/substrate-binding protein n=1 Tax=Aestuarierythrobacter aquiaggeris TaxID=1898396 RepID=UPI0030174CE6
MIEVWTALLGLGDRLAAHVILSAAALALGTAVALPLAIWAGRSPMVARLSLGFASLVQTVPALALLALFFPILLSLRAVFGEGLPTLGFLPALLALSLYALLPILRNAVTARANLDPGVLEAADGVGMTQWQKLRLVEAPLSAPFVMAGIRTAAVWTIGAATLSTTIGQPSLGDPIFAGLQTQNWALVLAGCIAAAGLAIATDGLLGLVEKGLRDRQRWMVWAGSALAATGLIIAFASQTADDDDTVTIGAKNFSEQYILARLVGQRLETAGFNVRYRDGLGSAVVHEAVTTGAIDISIDYSGTLWTNQLNRSDNLPAAQMLSEIKRWEAETSGALMLGALGFENAYAFAMKQSRADELGIRTLDDLARAAPTLVMGGDVEFFERPEWKSVRDAYGLKFARQRNFTSTFMYDALTGGEADVISAYTSDGRIAADRLLVLEDPRDALPAYDALLILAPQHSENDQLKAALQPLIGAIDVAAMREANFAVDRTKDKQTPARAAAQLAAKLGLD